MRRTHRRNRKLSRFSDYMRRNVLSYRYIKKNILMTMLVIVLSVMLIALVRYGENVDPLADELYENKSIDVEVADTIMMNPESVTAVTDAVSASDSQMASGNNRVVAAAPLENNENITTEERTAAVPVQDETSMKKEGTMTADGVRVREYAGIDADVLTTTAIGDVYEVKSETEDWVEIVLADGSSGYVSAEYISVVTVVVGDMDLDE